jgi:DNA-binding beta-propeller fold protein YncE
MYKNTLTERFFAMVQILPILLSFALLTESFAQEKAVLIPAQTIPLPGVQGRFDHFSIDVKNQRLFVAALGNNTVEVIDIVSCKRLHTISGMSKPTGVLYLAEPNQIYVANGIEGTLKIFDGAAFKLMYTLGELDDADNLRYDSKTKLAYLGYGDGAIAVIDTLTAKQIASISLPAHPEAFQLEKNGPRLFVNLPNARQIAVIDRNKRAVIAVWPFERFLANFPMALDEADNRLFIGCRKPARLVVLDTITGKSVTDMVISGDTDDLFYDAALKRLYLSCGEGFIDVIDQVNPGSYQLRERIATSPGARTAYFCPDFGYFCLAVPLRDKQDAEIRVYKVR